MLASAIESSEREECGGNPKTRKEPTDQKLGGHVRLRGVGGPGLCGVQESANYGRVL